MAQATFPKVATLKFFFEYDKVADVLKYKTPWNHGQYGYHYGTVPSSKFGTTIGNKGNVVIRDERFSVQEIISAIA
jgi:hypothetical protein